MSDDNHETRFAPIEALLLKHGWRGYFGYGGGDRRDKGGESFAIHVDIARADDYVGDEGEHLHRVRVVDLKSDEVIIPYPTEPPPPLKTPEFDAWIAARRQERLLHENRAYADIRRKVVAWIATKESREPAEVEPLASEEEIIRVVAHLLLEAPEVGYNSPRFRVAGPWVPRKPDALGLLKHGGDLTTERRPQESWVRPVIGANVNHVSIYRNWPTVQAMEPFETSPPFVWPGEPDLGPISGTEVFWKPNYLFMREVRKIDSPRAIPRNPATSVAEAMEAANTALREAGIWLAEEMVR